MAVSVGGGNPPRGAGGPVPVGGKPGKLGGGNPPKGKGGLKPAKKAIKTKLSGGTPPKGKGGLRRAGGK
jgi:hypothetical protein